MIPFNAFAPAWFPTIILFGSAEQDRISTLNGASQQVGIQMTPGQVSEIIGPPDNRLKADDILQLAFLEFHSDQWCWVSTVDPRALPGAILATPNPFPFHRRLFSYHQDDLVICWDANHRFSVVRRQELHLPQPSEEMNQTWKFICDKTKLRIAAPWQG